MAKKDQVVVANPKAGGLVAWESQLAEAAVEIATTEAGAVGGRFLSIRGGILAYAGQPIAGNSLDVVILDSVFENAYYEGEFDPDNPHGPTCFAIGRNDKELEPHENVEEKQNDICKTCWANKFNSAEKGRGKACKNIRRIALITADALKADVIAKQDVAFLRIPVTSVPGWALYVQKLANVLKRPPFGVVTKLSVVPDAKSQFKVTFEPGKMIPADIGAAILAKIDEAKEAIEVPYEPAESEPEPVKRKAAAAKPSKKPAAAAKPSKKPVATPPPAAKPSKKPAAAAPAGKPASKF